MDVDNTDFFGDDDCLEDLPAEVLNELENSAIQFTQALAQRNWQAAQSQTQPPQQPGEPSSSQAQLPYHHIRPQLQQQRQPHQSLPREQPYAARQHGTAQGGAVGQGYDQETLDQVMQGFDDDDFGDFQLEEDDLDTTEVLNDNQVPVGRPVADKSLPKAADQPTTWNRPNVPGPRTAAPPKQALPFPSPDSRAFPVTIAPPQPSQFTHHAPPPAPSRFPLRPQPSQQPALTQSHPPGDIVSALQRRVRALETELNLAKGEVAIIRANTAKTTSKHQEELARLQRIAEEKAAERDRAMEAAAAAERNVAADMMFRQQDLREANSRAKVQKYEPPPPQQQQQQHGDMVEIGMATPKKSMIWKTTTDGFDDMDMLGLSPGKKKALERTPRKGKRKRPVADIPVAALETHTNRDTEGEGAGKEEIPVVVETPQTTLPAPPSYDFLQLLLDHGAGDAPPTFQSLAQISFPSDPSISLAQLIIHKLPLMGDPARPIQLLVDFAEYTIGLWAQCYDEGILSPAGDYLVCLLKFILQLNATTVAPLIMNSAVPVATSCLVIVIEGRNRGVELQGVDTTSVLGLLYLIALSCICAPAPWDSSLSPIATFWSLFPLEPLLPLLPARQRVGDVQRQRFDDVLGALDLLCTSALPTSIGPIGEDKDPEHVARMLVDRVSLKLVEAPKWLLEVPADRHRLRKTALRTLIRFMQSGTGLMALATHSHVIPRLVVLLSASVDELYDIDVPSGPDQGSSSLNEIITRVLQVLHILVTSPRTAAVADVLNRLAASHGGTQRYRVALSRLCFAEGPVMEAGISDQTSTYAHELLELAVTPDEGEQIPLAFKTRD